jgi:hypothetical protein
LSIFPLRLCEKPSRTKAQRLRSIAETKIKAQLINWFQAVKIKIRPKAFVLPPITPKKSRNMSQFFLVGIFFLLRSEEVSVDFFISAVCGLAEKDEIALGEVFGLDQRRSELPIFAEFGRSAWMPGR